MQPPWQARCSFDPRTVFAARCSLARTGRSLLPVMMNHGRLQGPSRANRDRKDGRRMARFTGLAAFLCLSFTTTTTTTNARAYVFNPADFATEVVEYVPGAGVGTDFL